MMLRDVIVKGRSLSSTSDLTLLAPIKPGFIDSLESVTYKTRIKRVLDTLHAARVATREYHTAQLLSDSIERVAAIHSVRVAVLEPQDNVLLAVTFDGSWESYIRVLYDKVGTLLDLIFCGTVDYVVSSTHTFDEWHAWARRVQVETAFFYGSPETSAQDALYQRRVEHMRLVGHGVGGPFTEMDELRASLPSAEERVERFVQNQREALVDDPQVLPVRDVRMVSERMRIGLLGLAAIYRLVDLHRPGTPDGDVLRLAAGDLLREFVQMRNDGLVDEAIEKASRRFPRQLAWLFDGDAMPVPRQVPALSDDPSRIVCDRDKLDIQGGILETYDGITHGALLLLAFRTPAVAELFFREINPRITTAAVSHEATVGSLYCNVGLTLAGLRACGVSEDTLGLFPEEFRQGMEKRAGLLGDVRNNHPLRWRLPTCFTDIDADPGDEKMTVDMQSVHAVLQWRCKLPQGAKGEHAYLIHDPDHPLRNEILRLIAAVPQLQVLAVQPLLRNSKPNPAKPARPTIMDHFGYADGEGQPDLFPTDPPFDLNRIQLGELVIGHTNAADVAVCPFDPSLSDETRLRLRWMYNGSFLVVRKYRMYVDRMEKAVHVAATQMMRKIRGLKRDEATTIVYAKLMGRNRDTAEPLAPHRPPTLNNFIYGQDRQGILCPLRAHIRRANPRLPRGTIARPPRLMRRSISYGPKFTSPHDAGIDRGLVFMAYNASLGEQFEVVQRWLSGGNSTGTSTTESCPIVGVPENGITRYFRFEHAGKAFRVRLEPEPDVKPFDEPSPLTTLQWGLYLFTPSIMTLAQLRSTAATAAVAPLAQAPWQLAKGRALVAELQRLEREQGQAAAAAAWKSAIEDPESIDRLDAAAIWAAIREDHGGLLRTSYATIVADRAMAAEVYLDAQHRYSVCGQFERMKRSFGEISLGMDEGPVYHQQSDTINDAIRDLGIGETFDIAFGAAKAKIDAIKALAIEQSITAREPTFDVVFEAREVIDAVLVSLCNAWFGLDSPPREEGVGGPPRRLIDGSTDWAWTPGKPPLYPGHFTAMSRYMFQPNPGPTVVTLGEQYGKALRIAMRAFVEDHRIAGTKPTWVDLQGNTVEAPIAKAAFDHPLGRDADFVARTMVGVLMGFNPTISGAVLNVLRELQRDGSFSALRAKLAEQTDFTTVSYYLRAPIARAAQMRPMPQIGWRTVVVPHRLGGSDANGVDLERGDIVVMGIVSGTQQSLEDGKPDEMLMFGGDRTKSPHPTHACPGYQAAIGAMLGTIAAMLARPESIRESTGSLTYSLEGDVVSPGASGAPTARGPRPKEFDLFDQTPSTPPTVSGRTAPTNRKGLVLGWGDSWLDYRLPLFGTGGVEDIRDQLANFSYQAPPDFCKWTRWPKIETMAGAPDAFCQFIRDQVQTSAVKLKAIVLSGGGNDSTGTTLEAMINEKGSSQDVINPQRLSEHIGRIEVNYVKVIDRIRTTLAACSLPAMKIIVHGYDHPFPDAKDGIDVWLARPFTNRGYDPVADRNARVDAMKLLIDALNEMMKSQLDPLPNVQYVDLRGTIATHWPADAKLGWANDLHPTSDGFKLMALAIDAAIQSP